MRKSFKKFISSSWGLEIWRRGEIIFRSKKLGVKGLLDFIIEHGRRHRNLVIFDKIVGQGAALLAVYLGVKEVYGAVGSKLAAEVLRKYKIKFCFQQTIPCILNKNKTDICPIEKLSLDKTPEKFYYCLRRACDDSPGHRVPRY